MPDADSAPESLPASSGGEATKEKVDDTIPRIIEAVTGALAAGAAAAERALAAASRAFSCSSQTL